MYKGHRDVKVLPLISQSATYTRVLTQILIPSSFSFRSCHLRLRPIQHLLELCDAVAHPRMHVSLRAFDVVMKIVAEELDVRYGARCNVRFGEVTRKQNEGDVSDVVSTS
jgi:hypothetical protein